MQIQPLVTNSMNYIQLYFLPLLTALYGAYLYFVLPRRGDNFADIAGMIMFLLSGAAFVITTILWAAVKMLHFPDKAYVRIIVGVLGVVFSYFLLWIYVQVQNIR